MNKSSADSSCSPDSSASQNIFRTKNCKPTRFAIACGGTGGHMYPGVAVANALKAKGSEVALVLSGRAVEGNRPAGWDGEVISVPCMQPHFKSPLLAFASLVSLVKSFFIALIRFRKFRPHALLAMGSYTSFGPVLAARISGTAVVLHDSNAIPGVAVSKLSHFARIVCVAFDEAVRYLPVSVNTTNTGMPIRMDITEQDPGEYADPSRFTILVMGGSQGAKKLNKKVADAIALLDKDPGEASALRIIHLAGRKNEAEVRSLYGRISNIPV
ncbi:MAG: hypothetical protein GX804_06795 [Lentisphaerae bacterium]|nr:hypothetical protein [Lentisphaerota bacterium]